MGDKKKKIAIVGAGICGLYLARKLSDKGHLVSVFEKKDKIGKEACSGLFSQRIIDFIPESKGLAQNYIKSAKIHFPRKDINLVFSKDFLVMDHASLDRLAAELAKKSGVKIFLNNKVINVPTGFDRIIGCDGALSFIRKKLHLREPSFQVGIQGFVQRKSFNSFVEVWPTREGGFVWRIPRGESIEYGIMSTIGESRSQLDRFLKERDIKIERIRSALIPQGFLIPKNKKITLCGDAAGLCKPWSGGGVIWGLTAADILLKTFPDFIAYQKEMKKFFLPRILLSKLATKLTYFLGFNFPWIFPQKIQMENDFLIKVAAKK